jgi:hypothetical protein
MYYIITRTSMTKSVHKPFADLCGPMLLARALKRCHPFCDELAGRWAEVGLIPLESRLIPAGLPGLGFPDNLGTGY